MTIDDAKRKLGVIVEFNGSGIKPSSKKELNKKGYSNCVKCKDIKKIHKFNMKTKSGRLSSTCKVCRSEYMKTKNYKYKYNGKYRNKEADRIYDIKNRESTRKRKAQYYKDNTEYILERCNNYRKSEEGRKVSKEYRTNNRPKFNAIGAKRRSRKLLATPPWSELDKIEVLYKNAKELEELTGLQYHVDHIVPLQNKDVCGLHVWSNLQILEASINLTKKNKFDLKENR
jgi:hypothetical protein